MRYRSVLTFAIGTALVATTATAQVKMKLKATINLDTTSTDTNPEYIGTNPGAVAWNGTDLWVAGYNNDNPANPPKNISIIRVVDPLAQVAAPTTPYDPSTVTGGYGTVFGTLSTPGFRGYVGLAIRRFGNQTLLAATWDNGGADPNGLQLFNTGTSNRLWAKNLRGGAGPAFDPGFPGGNPAQGSGVAWTTFGSGRRALQEAVVGTDIWDTTNGMIWLPPAVTSVFPRDMAFDGLGNIYVRVANEVVRAQRTGDNATINPTVLVDNTDAAFVGVQNIEFFRSLLIFNDRPVAAIGQLPIEDPNQPGAPYVIKIVRASDGSELAVDWDGGFDDPSTPGSLLTGGGAYDFSYDAATNSLAILDFTNRNCLIFSVEASPIGTTNCLGSNGQPLSLTVDGNFVPGQTMNFAVTGAQANAPTQVLIGLTTAQVPLPTTPCTIYIDPIVAGFPVAFADAAGNATTSWLLPPFVPPVAFTAQAVAVDAGLPASGLQVTLSNGLQIDIR